MRWPWEGRSNAAAPAPAKADLPQSGEAGRDSDSWYAYVLGGGPDVNPMLTGTQKFIEYDEMRKTDASIKSLLSFVKLPVRSGNWGLNPRSDDPLDIAIRDFVAWNVGLQGEDGQMDLSWDEQLQQGLQMLDFGPMFEELVWEDPKNLIEWRDADGDPHLVLPLRRLAPRYPRSIQIVKMDGARVSEITQWMSDTKPIPGDKLSYLIFEREGGRWDGVSMLRPAWGAWRIKKALMVAAGIGWDRFASGIPVVYHPDNPKDKQVAGDIGREIRQHERGYVSFPASGVSQNGSPESLWKLDLLNGAPTMADPVGLLQWLSDQIATTGLQHFSSLGRSGSNSGSRAVGEVQADPYYLSIQAVAGYLRDERTRQVLRRIVEVNFGAEAARTRTPILTVSKIQSRSVQTISQAIALLGSAGFTFTDRESQDDVRELLGLPQLPDALAGQGIDRAQLESVLQGLGLDSATFAQIVNALPPDIGVARNRNGNLPAEGAGLTA